MTDRVLHSLLAFLLGATLSAAQEKEEPERKPELPESLVQASEAAAKGDFETAATLLKEEAEKGNADAAFGLAEFYILGRGVEPSATEALKWYSKAEAAGNPMALFRQGEIYLRGAKDVKANEARGKFLLQGAAEAGIPAAWHMLGQLSEARGQAADAEPEREKHFAQARTYYLKGAEAGGPNSQEAYARFLADGLAGEANPAEAAEWLTKAATRGLPSAMNQLGLNYQNGTGVERDPIHALGWFLAAAERGSLPAMTNLGLCYLKGVGIPANPDQAGAWFAKASKQSFAPAQHLLGYMFEEGLGTESNLVFAYVNYARAARQGLPQAEKAMSALDGRLSEEQRKEAEGMLQEPASENDENENDEP